MKRRYAIKRSKMQHGRNYELHDISGISVIRINLGRMYAPYPVETSIIQLGTARNNLCVNRTKRARNTDIFRLISDDIKASADLGRQPPS
jgi:hypothetical protein